MSTSFKVTNGDCPVTEMIIADQKGVWFRFSCANDICVVESSQNRKLVDSYKTGLPPPSLKIPSEDLRGVEGRNRGENIFARINGLREKNCNCDF